MELQKINLVKTDSPHDLREASIHDQPPATHTPMSTNSFLTPSKIIGLIIALSFGLVSGYYLKNNDFGKGTRNSGAVIARNVPEDGLKEGDIIGIQDEKTFKDSATGILHKGGIDGEGSHQLLRPGGASQTVYLTSSVIDLDEFDGHQVTIWGETFQGRKAGWLMDVGRVKVEKLNASNPE